MTNIKEGLKQARNAKGWSQVRLAEDASLSRRVIEKIESGETLYPNLNTLDKLATALGLTIDELAKRINDN